MSKVVTMDQAVAMIQPNDLVITSGFLTAGTPDAIMKAVADSFDATGSPNNLTIMYAAGQGNKKGGQQERWAKEGLINRMRTDRIIKSDIIWTYINAQDLGQSVDPRIKLYNDVQTMTLKDIVDFQKEWVKGRTYVYCILGDKKDLDMNKLKAVGPIEELTQEQIFGY